jgi:hypothetical protein
LTGCILVAYDARELLGLGYPVANLRLGREFANELFLPIYHLEFLVEILGVALGKLGYRVHPACFQELCVFSAYPFDPG